ncbi:MAG: hypothetical protein AB7S65_00335 [Sulfuricurvum sp.]
MRRKDPRITMYCELFNLTSDNSRTVAGRKINKNSKDLPSEYIFSLMSNEDLATYLDFCNNQQQEIIIKLRHNRKTQNNEIKIEMLNKLVEIDQIEEMKYYAYRPLKKTDNDLIKAYEKSIDANEDNYHNNQENDQLLYQQFLKWHKKFAKKHRNLSDQEYGQALSFFMNGDEYQFNQLVENIINSQKNIKIVQNYSAYLFLKKQLIELINIEFRGTIIHINISEFSDEQIIKNLIDHFEKYVNAFSFTFQIDKELIYSIIKKELNKLVKKYTRSQ